MASALDTDLKVTIPQKKKAWANTAFLIETLVLLVFLAGSIAIFALLFTQSIHTTDSANELSTAATIAQNAAEEFASDPTAVAAGEEVGQGVAKNGSDTWGVNCEVSTTETDAGQLMTAHISVYDKKLGSGEPAYELTTSRYISSGTPAAAEAEVSISSEED